MEKNDTRLFERGLSLFHLKCIAMIAMTCDHVGGDWPEDSRFPFIVFSSPTVSFIQAVNFVIYHD